MCIRDRTAAYVYTPWKEDSKTKRAQFKREVAAVPHVKLASLGNSPAASFGSNTTVATYRKAEKEIHTTVYLLYGDLDFLEVYDIELLAGRMPLNDSIK